MWLYWLGAAIELVLYVVIFASALYLTRGLWLSAWGLVRGQIVSFELRQRARTASTYRGNRQTKQSNKKVPFYRQGELHLMNLVEATTKWSDREGVNRFLWTSLAVAIALFVFTFFGTQKVPVSILSAVVFFHVPYAMLRVKKHWLSIRNSYDIDPVVRKLLPKYRTLKHNMQFALRDSLAELPDIPIRRTLSRLYTRMSRYTTPAEASRIAAQFDNQVGTAWAQQLSNIIVIGWTEGVDVEQLLVDLVEDIKGANQALKKQRTERLDTMFIGITPIFLLPGSLFYLQVYMTHKTLQFEFHTSQGTTHFILALLLGLMSFFIAIIFYRPKQDI